MRTTIRPIDMTKPTDAFRNFSNTPKMSFYIALFIYLVRTTKVQKDNIATCLSTAYNYVREWVRHPKSNVLLSFRIAHVQ